MARSSVVVCCWMRTGDAYALFGISRNQRPAGASAGDDVVNLGGKVLENVANEFHVYSLDWYEDKMVFAVDGLEHYTYQPEIKDLNTWPFISDQYILLNIAIKPDIDLTFEESAMVIDYVRIYQ